MLLVEKEITLNNIERAQHHAEFESRREVEQKLLPVNPDIFEQLFKPESVHIEQLYLSTPKDEFSLRLRCTHSPSGAVYKATQKDRGSINEKALDRIEIDTTISQEAYEHYRTQELPSIQKRRFEVADGVSVDFYENEQHPVIVEVEHKDPEVRAALVAMVETLTGSSLIDHSSDPTLTNEAIAHRDTEREVRSPESLDTFTENVVLEMVARYVSGSKHVVVGLTGMSGSGKTTVTNGIRSRLVETFGESFCPIIVSTDDYHFGKTALEQTHGIPYSDWDGPQTYNTAELSHDLELLRKGTPLIKRHFDFETEEPSYDELVSPSPFVIIEGLYAGSKDLSGVRDLHFELPTSIATSIGRDVRRLIIDDRANRAFPTPESRLRYQIETALPLYLSQERPGRNTYSASVRSVAERAFMLVQLTD